MENYTYNSYILQIEGFMVSNGSLFFVFFFFLFAYISVMVMNIGISLIVFFDRSLHQPMYLLLCNLSISDIFGSTHIVPRLLSDILLPPSERLITYYECVAQAFTSHMFGTTSHTVLMIMAFDRYVAICNPLRYSSIRTMIMNPYCDNTSLFKLSCEDVTINNIYGLTFTVVLLTSSIGCMVLTYSKITFVCLTSKSKSLNRKALKTCSTHLLVYVIMLVSGFIVIILHRFPQYSDYRKLAALLFVIVPGSFNPIIYGIQSKEMRKFLSGIFSPNKCLTSCKK
ncbi:olfactory receptor 52D1-like [Parambassis ranga]|uniref:Olfactory receptor 52D1-like n=1 Tax=Parambassis ranga TaxID=210632 RepID=A0A6P7JLQ9_9TELE|nr:olfactory receptor 52D1-like [Parambassis ranga]